MSGPDGVGMTWQPTWRRLIASTLVCFALVLALLAWRVQSGSDPALGSGTSTALTATTTTTTDDTSTSSSTASDDATSSSSADDGTSSSSDTTTTLPSTGAS